MVVNTCYCVFCLFSSRKAMESTESRFAHLLQPIRELTKNWEIDVASELNDYLEEVICGFLMEDYTHF